MHKSERMKRRRERTPKPKPLRKVIGESKSQSELNSFTLDQLKDFAGSVGMPKQYGNKSEIVESIFLHLFPRGVLARIKSHIPNSYFPNSHQEGLFSFTWEGTLLASIPFDLAPMIYTYWTQKRRSTGVYFQKQPKIYFGCPEDIHFVIDSTGNFYVSEPNGTLPETGDCVLVYGSDGFQKELIEFNALNSDIFGEYLDFNDVFMVFDELAGTLLVCDNVVTGTDIRRYDSQTKRWKTVLQVPFTAEGFALDHDSNIVLGDPDRDHPGIKVFSQEGDLLRVLPAVPRFESQIVVDPRGNFVFLDPINSFVTIHAPTGEELVKISNLVPDTSRCKRAERPRRIAVTPDGNIVIGDETRFKIYSSEGTLLSIPKQNLLEEPGDIRINKLGEILVGDRNHITIYG